MVLAVTAPVRQPTGPQIAQIISNSGLRTPKVRRNRASGYYTAEWCQAGLVKSVPPAAFFREKLESRFDGIKILNTQEVKASWRDGHPIIISCVHFEIIDNMREKQIQIKPLDLSVIIPSLLAAIQRSTVASLPMPQQPFALLPASIPTRINKRERLASRQTTIFSETVLYGLSPSPAVTVPPLYSSVRNEPALMEATCVTSRRQERGAGGEVNEVSLHETDSSPLSNTIFMRQHGKSALIEKLRAEAQAAGANAVRHYRMVNPPIQFPTLAEMEEEANTIIINIEAQS
jgi:hypothetical protein